VLDNVKGKPLAGMMVSVLGPANPRGAGSNGRVQTGRDGSFRIRVAPGQQELTVINGAAWVQQQVVVASGQTRRLDIRVKAPEIDRPIQGVVLDPDGKPVPGAEVIGPTMHSTNMTSMTDLNGRFVFDKPALPPKTLLFARSGDLFTKSGTPISGSGDVTLHIYPAAASSFYGLVRDDRGAPVAGAQIGLNRRLGSLDVEWSILTTSTDAQGRYSFGPTYPGFSYFATAAAPGCAINVAGVSPGVPGIAGKRIAFPNLIVTRADSFVGGKIFDNKGMPVAGADIFDGDVNPRLHTNSDSKGRFRLNGVPRKHTLIQIQVGKAAYPAIDARSGHADIIFTLGGKKHPGNGKKG
jgi:hypothetical protein